MNRPLPVIRAALVVAVGVLLGTATPAGAQEDRSLTIDSFEVEAVVKPDGSMDVVEELAFDFDGDFNGGTREIPPGDYEIVDLTVTENGEPRDLAAGFDDPNGGEVRWFGSADHSQVSGEHTYELHYTVLEAAQVFPDVGVLNWQFVGTGFPELARVAVDVTMPGDGEGLRAFAHGDLRGVVVPDGATVHIRVVDNPAGSPVEARIVVPSSVFTVVPSGEPALAGILAEEGAFAEEANAARARAASAYVDEVARGPEPGCDEESSPVLERRCADLDRLLAEADSPSPTDSLTLEDAERYFAIVAARAAIVDEVDRIQAERAAGIGNVAGPVVAALAGGAWFVLWRRFGKEPARPTDIGDYWREVPEESPAVVAALDDWGVVDAKAFASTVVDLAQRGWLTIIEEPGRGDGHRFVRSQQTTDELPLRGYESKVLWRLFDGGRPSISQQELMEEAKADRTGSAAWMTGFKAEVRADYDTYGFQDRRGCMPWLAHVAIVGVLLLTALATFGLGAWIGLGVATVILLVVVGCSGLLRRRTERGARKHAEIGGLKAFLRDFSLVDDVPVGHLALYERYLVYAVALGVADRLIAGLRMRFPELADPNQGFAVWYVPGLHGGGSSMAGMDKLAGLSSMGSFADGLSAATASAFSPPSSSSGGGGGFSGGSSGGGGGGSAGGW